MDRALDDHRAARLAGPRAGLAKSMQVQHRLHVAHQFVLAQGVVAIRLAVLAQLVDQRVARIRIQATAAKHRQPVLLGSDVDALLPRALAPFGQPFVAIDHGAVRLQHPVGPDRRARAAGHQQHQAGVGQHGRRHAAATVAPWRHLALGQRPLGIADQQRKATDVDNLLQRQRRLLHPGGHAFDPYGHLGAQQHALLGAVEHRTATAFEHRVQVGIGTADGEFALGQAQPASGQRPAEDLDLVSVFHDHFS